MWGCTDAGTDRQGLTSVMVEIGDRARAWDEVDLPLAPVGTRARCGREHVSYYSEERLEVERSR